MIPQLLAYAYMLAVLAGPQDGSVTPLDVTDIAAPTFTVFSAEDGLSDEIWNTIGLDHEGFIWAGSASSVARFDGRRWQDRSPARPIGLVRDMLTDTQGQLWAIFEREGLNHYLDHQWQPVGDPRFYYSFSNTLREDGQTDDWLIHDHGVLRLSRGIWHEDPGNASLTRGRVVGIEETQSLFGERRQWLTSSESTDSLLYRTLSNRAAPGPWLPFAAPETRNLTVTDLLRTQDRTGESLWIMSYGDGLLRLRDDGIRIWHAAVGELPTEAIYNAVSTLDSNGLSSLWVATRAGLMRVRDDQIVVFDKRHGLPSDAIRQVRLERVDGMNVLWLATEGGIARTVLTQSQWQTVSLHGARENGIFGVMIEPNGRGSERLWAGSASQGLAMLEDGHWRTFERTESGLPLINLRQIRLLPGPDGKDWRLLSLMGGHLLRIGDDLSFNALATPWPMDAEEAVVGMYSRSGSQGPELWFGMMLSGIYRLDRQGWTHFETPEAAKQWKVFAFADQIDANGHGWLWAATEDGLARYDGKAWTLLPDSFGLQDGLRGLTLITDSGRPELWMGSNRLGMLRMDVSHPDAPVLINDDRVPPAQDAVVYSVLRDSKARIYLCTNNGVQLLSPNAAGGYDDRVFRRRDGLIHDECNTNSQLIDANDRYWVGTLGGLGMFDPRIATSNGQGQSKPLRLTEIRIDDKIVPVPESGQIRVPAGSRDLRIDYAVLSSIRDAQSRYRTWLRNEDAQPGDWTSESSRILSRLSPGQHQLQIEAVDYSGSAAQPLLLTLNVEAQWWQHGWAKALGTLLLLLTVAGAVSIYNRRLRAHQRELKHQVAQQTAELNAANQQLRRLSYQDALTGVANRRRLTEAMETAVTWAGEYGRTIGLILVDVDHFKHYNDRFGHLAGDVALTAVAQALRSAVREQDLVARFGGEEFACLLLDADEATVMMIAERMRLLVQALPPRTIGNDDQTLTISAGVLCTVPDALARTSELLEQVDKALYRAKAAGRNCVSQVVLS